MLFAKSPELTSSNSIEFKLAELVILTLLLVRTFGLTIDIETGDPSCNDVIGLPVANLTPAEVPLKFKVVMFAQFERSIVI